ncbi:EthD domain-containing protein [Nocardioides sp. BGMRC 2183]|nr:EthD domain-containing protein [Nocardioides sp. BGMRC 2183]
MSSTVAPGEVNVKGLTIISDARHCVAMTAALARPNAPTGLIRSVAPVRRRPDLHWDEFSRHWREEHAAIASRLAGMTSYVQAHAHPDLQAAGTPAAWRYDGAAFAGFADLEALEQMRADEGYRSRAVADEAEFVDRAAMAAVLLVDDWVDPPADPVAMRRTVLVFVRAGATDGADAGRALARQLAAGGGAGPSGSAWSRALGRDPGLAPGGADGCRFDALLELWFEEPAAAAVLAERLVATRERLVVSVVACLVAEENRVI